MRKGALGIYPAENQEIEMRELSLVEIESVTGGSTTGDLAKAGLTVIAGVAAVTVGGTALAVGGAVIGAATVIGGLATVASGVYSWASAYSSWANSFS